MNREANPYFMEDFLPSVSFYLIGKEKKKHGPRVHNSWKVYQADLSRNSICRKNIWYPRNKRKAREPNLEIL